ncbi:MAG: response regulator transcription factor [Acidobacteria bacterium]|nr:response regulator transcription factor [Acidobacteriota bacterium]
MSDQPIRLLVVDDHRIVREGLAKIIADEPDIVVIGSAGTGEEAVAAFERDPPDVVLMDLRLPGMGGVEAIRAIRARDADACVVVLTMYDGDEDIHRALEVGATTYLLKDSLSDDLIRVVREVHAGGRPMPAAVRARLEDRATRPTLTQREIRVLQLVMQGKRNKEIAAALAISEETVEAHLKNIFTKLDVHDRTTAVYVALRRGIVHVD